MQVSPVSSITQAGKGRDLSLAGVRETQQKGDVRGVGSMRGTQPLLLEKPQWRAQEECGQPQSRKQWSPAASQERHEYRVLQPQGSKLSQHSKQGTKQIPSQHAAKNTALPTLWCWPHKTQNRGHCEAHKISAFLKLWDNKSGLFKDAKFVVIFMVAMEN